MQNYTSICSWSWTCERVSPCSGRNDYFATKGPSQKIFIKNFKRVDKRIFIGIENFRGLKSDEDDDDEESAEDEDDSDLSSDSDTSEESEDEENLADSVENGRTHSGKART